MSVILRLTWGVYFFVGAAHAGDMYGMFMVVKGDIKITNLQNQQVTAKVGSKILPGEGVTSGPDSRGKIVMADRNVINVSPSTEFKIDKYVNDAKTGNKNVEINLVDGKVRTNVEQKYDGDKNKFLIKTATAVAGVRGTQFLVSYDRQTQMTSVVTLKGSVMFAPRAVNGGPAGQAVMVQKNESTTMSAGSAPEPPKVLPREEIKKIDSETSASAAPPKEPARATADAKKGDTKRNPASPNEPVVKEEPTPGVKSSAPAAPAKMIDKGDLDTGMAKEIRTPAMETAAPTGAALPPAPPPAAPAISPTVGDMINQRFDKTKVTIKPFAN